MNEPKPNKQIQSKIEWAMHDLGDALSEILDASPGIPGPVIGTINAYLHEFGLKVVNK